MIRKFCVLSLLLIAVSQTRRKHRRKHQSKHRPERCRAQSTSDLWSAKELRKSVEGRTGRPRPKLDDLCYVQNFVDLDANWTFRFLDLPPEIRNLIYGHLLQLRDSRSRADLSVCSPAILGTCKQIQSEAQALLFSENVFEVNMRSAAMMPGRKFRNRTTVAFAKLDIDDLELEDVSAAEINNLWPTCVLKAESFKLVIKPSRQGDQDNAHTASPSFEQANHVLHFRVSSQHGSASLKSLQVILKGDLSSIPETLLLSILYPLTELRHISPADFTLEGLPVGVTAELRRLLEDKTRQLYKDVYKALGTERRKAMELYVRAMEAGTRHSTGSLDVLARCAQKAGRCLKADGVYVDSTLHARCEAHLLVLKACLGDPVVREVEARRGRSGQKGGTR